MSLCLLCVSLTSTCFAFHEVAEKPSVQVDLVDGSRIVGAPGMSVLKGRTQYGQLDIPLASLNQFVRLDDGQIKIDFSNGDEMTLRPAFDQLECATLFGDVVLKMEHVSRMRVRSQVLSTLPAADQIVVYYGFDSADAGDIPNQAQDAMHAKNLGAGWNREGVNGGAIEFDGSSRLEIPHDKLLCPKTFTLAAWVYPTEESTNYEMLFAKTNASSWHGGYGVCRMSGDSENVRFFINGYTTLFKSCPLPIYKWTHLACVAHGEGIQFYVNGVAMEADSKRTPSNVLAARVQHTNTPMTLGGDPSHYGWKGLMDEFLLYDRALSRKQVQDLFGRFSAPKSTYRPAPTGNPKNHAEDPQDAAMEGGEF